MKRKGMMVGSGKRGYHNIIPKDPIVHSQSAKGMKQPQKIRNAFACKSSFTHLYPKRLETAQRLPTRQPIDKIEFQSNVRSVTAYGVREDYGKQTQTMELFAGKDNYYIEWDIGDGLDYAEIGIWTENVGSKKVTDYDGVFELPKQAKQLLRRNGFDLSELEMDIDAYYLKNYPTKSYVKFDVNDAPPIDDPN